MSADNAVIDNPTRWFHHLANWLVKRGNYKRVPSLPNPTEVQIHRYFVLYGKRWWFPFGLALHRIVVDDIPVLHSHEWPHVALILAGGYADFTEHEVRHFRPGMIKVRGHRTRHFIKLAASESWSLILVGPRGHIYGYTDENGDHVRRDIFLYGRVTDTSSLRLTRAELEYLRSGRRYYRD